MALRGWIGLVIGAWALLGCDGGGGGDAGPGVDAAAVVDGAVDAAAVVDGAVVDGAVVDDAGSSDAGPPETGHCAATDLIIAAVSPLTSITLFNPTSAAIDTGSRYFWCERPRYPAVEAVTIPPGGSHTFDWPSTFTSSTSGGEIALYRSRAFTDPTSQIDFLCWGTGHSPTRQNIAEMDGDWAGGCAGAITGTEIQRVPESDGHGAASYDPTGAAAALSCP